MTWEAWMLVIYQTINALAALGYLLADRRPIVTTGSLAVQLLTSPAQVWLVLRLVGS